MKTLTRKEEREINLALAKEFLDQRLGIRANQRNVQRFAAHIVQFERWVKNQSLIRMKKFSA